MKRSLLTAALLTGALAGSAFAYANPSANPATAPATVMHTDEFNESNPFYAPSTLSMQAPDFAAIQTGHYLPAFKEGINQAAAEIQAIAENSAAAYLREHRGSDGAHRRATRSRITGLLQHDLSSHQTRIFRLSSVRVSPMLSAHNDNIYLNPALFKPVQDPS